MYSLAWRDMRARHFHDYTLLAAMYWLALTLAGLWALGGAAAWCAQQPLRIAAQVGGMAFAAALAACFPLRLSKVASFVLGGEVFIFLAFLLFGVQGAVLVGATETAIGVARESRRLPTRVVSVAIAALALHTVLSLVAGLAEQIGFLSSAVKLMFEVAMAGALFAFVGGTLGQALAWMKRTVPFDPRVVKHLLVPTASGALGAFVAAVIHLAFGANDTRNFVLASAVVASAMAALHYWQSERRSAERHSEELHRAAYTDSLTGLPNRRRFTALLDNLLESEDLPRYAVMFVDCDGFKLINDMLGHRGGDAFLCAVAERLKAQVRDSDTVARFGGDEFAVLLRDVDADQAREVAQRMLEAVRQPVSMSATLAAAASGGTRATTLSIGIALSENGYANGAEALRDADLAMHAAKDGGKNRAVVFDFEMSSRTKARVALEADAIDALDKDRYSLAYQPIFRITDKKLIGFESLARWNHPTKGPVSPGVFIPMLTRLGVITRLTRSLIPQGAHQLARWLAIHPGLKLHVNVCAADLVEADFPAFIGSVVHAAGLPPQSLVIELTESDLVDEVETTMKTLAELRALGVGVAIDDFGTGYSSLSRLTDMPVTSYKIDAAFVRVLKPDSKQLEVVKVIVALGRTLGKGVIAEGIETDEQLDLLLAAGCGYGQGFRYSRPLPVAEATAKIEQEVAVAMETGAGRLDFVHSGFHAQSLGEGAAFH